MSLVFADGFDTYGNILDLWDILGGDVSIRLDSPTKARTPPGYLQINSGAFGPTKTFGHLQYVLAATNWNSSTSGYVFGLSNLDADNGFNGVSVSIKVLLDGNVQVERHPAGGGSVLGTTATPGLVPFGSYSSIAMQVFCSATIGTVVVWVNGVIVLNLSGVNTTHTGRPDLLYYNAVQLLGPGGLPTLYHDDFYLLDCLTPPNTTFLGALKLYSLAPTANSSVGWVPLVGTNWSEVNEVPPDGDTSYVFSGNVGDLDQYVYPLTGIPANSSIAFLQHMLDMEVDSGSRSVASVLQSSAPHNPIALTTGYHIYVTPYDTQPGGSLIWTPAVFPITAGPKVTA
jgi:hypothetical protein